MSRKFKFRSWNEEFKIFTEMDLDEFDAQSWYNLSDPVQQYTGLSDKNGKEIYEGDLISYVYGYDKEPTITEVEWEGTLAGFDPFVSYDSDCHEYVKLETVEVIGNIYENPKLLVDNSDE